MSDRDQVVSDLLAQAGIARDVGLPVWSDIRKALFGARLDRWIDTFRALAQATPDRPRTALDLARVTPRIARSLGPDAALDLAQAVAEVAHRAGGPAAAGLISHAPRAATLLGDADGFQVWLASLGELAGAAPDVIRSVMVRTDTLLTQLDARGFRSFVAAGLALSDAAARAAHFALADPDLLASYRHQAGGVRLQTMERRLKALVVGLWGVEPVLRSAAATRALHVARRASFDGTLIRLPETFAGYSDSDAEALFKAAVAHIGAHLAFTREKFPVKTLKPLQVALVSLVEDARVEALAARQYPGLLRLWRRFHIAGEADAPAGPNLAEPLLARLARALIDPDFADDNPWIAKARRLFAEAGPDYSDPEQIRRIGMLLGNDLGQMRVQFNAKTHVVQPPYRDDNLGIWDFGPPPPDADDTVQTVLDSVRIERAETPDQPHDREREEPDPGGADRVGRLKAVAAEDGVPVARYPEWDYLAGEVRRDWTTVVEHEPPLAPAAIIDRILAEHADAERRIAALVRQARVSRPARQRRQPDGDRLDLNAAVGVAIDLRAGLSPDHRVYETMALMHRDMSVLLLLDISESTKDTIRGGAVSVFSLERTATALLAQAMAGVGDPFAIHAFCSNGRNDVRYFRIKDFGRPYDAGARRRLAGLRPGFSTRLGAALRHAGAEIAGQSTYRRLILVVTDGEPSDIDVENRRHLAEDARKAVHELGQQGIDVFCVALTGSGEAFLGRIFGRRNAVQIANVETLPMKLPMLYFRLTA
ncbi:VWA domain-containing protein [Rhodobacter sp. Har01]|uniref:VWA domain-containing protein n=1 Tax=Rhodobacter sp. Har01 TaxID=2883999 RepID=UPI001D08D7DA|nr:VWA domain-containing protein [Rhodobacter sp. Har01]MCB6179956.1 VWA domain-containing protein [Rhodobacter sp. Har01]